MPVIINEIEIVAPQPEAAGVPPRTAATRQPATPSAPTPKASYWVWRKLRERRLRLEAR